MGVDDMPKVAEAAAAGHQVRARSVATGRGWIEADF
jgi:hypothetical protein